MVDHIVTVFGLCSAIITALNVLIMLSVRASMSELRSEMANHRREDAGRLDAKLGELQQHLGEQRRIEREWINGSFMRAALAESNFDHINDKLDMLVKHREG